MKKETCSIFKFRLSMVIIMCLFLLVAVFGNPGVIPAVADDNSDNTYKSLKLFTDVLEELEKNYVDDVDSEELIHNAIQGMVGNLDPHSSFMPPEAFDELQDDTKGEFSGIGIVITMKDKILTVISPIEGTPAYKAGIQAGDIIIKIMVNQHGIWRFGKLST